MRHVILFAMLPAFLSVSTAEQPAPRPQVTFSTEVNYVEVTAVVTDAQDNYVRGLAKEDFRLLEDGKPQNVTVFAPVEIPVQRASAPAPIVAVEPDVRSNRHAFEGRLFIIVLDDLHTLAQRTNRVRAAARRFVEEHLGAGDLAAVVYTSGRADGGQELTMSRRLLLASIDRFVGRKLPSATLERLTEYRGQKQEAVSAERDTRDMEVRDPTDPARAFDARRMLQTLRGIVDWMGAISGRRKSVLLISEGIDYDVHDVFNLRRATDVLGETRDTVEAATRANVSIFSLDPRGLTSLGDEGLDIKSLPDEANLPLGPTSLQQEVRLTQDSLRVLADETGGFAVLNVNDMREGLEQIVRANSVYYVLGYNSPSAKPDGKFHPIEVRVNRPGLRVRARKGFVIPRTKGANTRTLARNDISPELRRTLDNPLPVGGMVLATSAAPFRTTGVAVTIELDGASLAFTETAGVFRDSVEVALMLIDPLGKVKTGDRHSVDLKLKAETHKAVAHTEVRLVSRMHAAPGRYQLKVAAREAGAGRAGSVLYDLEIPDFQTFAFSLSGVVLTSTRANLALTVKSDPTLDELLPAPPTAQRSFTQADTLAAAVELYKATGKAEHADVTTTVIRDDGRVMFRAQEEVAPGAWLGDRYVYKVLIALRDLAPAAYTLNIEARSRSVRDAPIIGRRVPFQVARAESTAAR